ncbi:MAG TPA: hypothetical protein VJ692_09655 [Nitrospiraceae bacterium]|nr:hypothetical protein [Nitrospiraceae bacterium]
MNHFLFVAGALRERDSFDSAALQLSYGLWGLRTPLIRDNLIRFLSDGSYGLVYVLKMGICARFQIISGVQSFEQLDQFVRDELRTEARYGFVRAKVEVQWPSSSTESLALLQRVLDVPDPAELTRRLSLGMHLLTQDQYEAIVHALG